MRGVGELRDRKRERAEREKERESREREGERIKVIKLRVHLLAIETYVRPTRLAEVPWTSTQIPGSSNYC